MNHNELAVYSCPCNTQEVSKIQQVHERVPTTPTTPLCPVHTAGAGAVLEKTVSGITKAGSGWSEDATHNELGVYS